MTYGLQVRTNTGVLQIDGTTSNFALASKGVITSFGASLFAVSPNSKTATITVTGTNPFVAIAGSKPWALYRTQNTGSTWTWTFVSTPFGPAPTSLTYYVFDTVTNLPGPSRGLFKIFDAAGNMIFHEDVKPLRVVDFIGDNGSNPPYTYTAGRSYAVIPANVEWYGTEALSARDPAPLGPGQYYVDVDSTMSAASVSGNSINAGLFSFENYQTTGSGSTAGYPFITQYGSSDWTVIDVTGY